MTRELEGSLEPTLFNQQETKAEIFFFKSRKAVMEKVCPTPHQTKTLRHTFSETKGWGLTFT